MAGLCSVHRFKREGCPACNATREEFFGKTTEELKEQDKRLYSEGLGTCPHCKFKETFISTCRQPDGMIRCAMCQKLYNDKDMRFNPNCETYAEALEYYKNRAVQLLKYDIKLTAVEYLQVESHGPNVIGVTAHLEHINGEKFISFYIFPEFRGKNLFNEAWTEDTKRIRILTSDDCHMEEFLIEQGYPYHCIKLMENQAYKCVSRFYGDGKAKRSGVYFMNHIDEGLAILNWINATQEAKDAYSLHPIFQMDDDLKVFDQHRILKETKFEWLTSIVLMNVMEYRNIANAYLSKRKVSNLTAIALSPLTDVNDMLIADKIQNYKDFVTYHAGIHPRTSQLLKYFLNWFERLGCTDRRPELINKLVINPQTEEDEYIKL